MPKKPAYLFTQQNTGSLFDQNVISNIENAQDIAKLLYNSVGAPEIFIFDPDMTYAIAVNCYSIHYIGSINLAEN